MTDDRNTTIHELRERAVEFRDERNWKQFHTPKDLALAIGIEAGELAELFLWKRDDEVAAALRDADFRVRVADELADVQLFLLLISAVTGIDIASAVAAKLDKNAAKYPVEKARGSAKKYSEFRDTD